MMNIDSALQRLMRSESGEPVNVIVGVRVGAKSFQAALDAAGFTTTGSSDFGGEVYLYGRIRAKDLAKLGGIEEIEFITPDTEERLL
jgi:hypothetical protein